MAIANSPTAGVRELEFTASVPPQATEVLANANMIFGTATASDLALQTGLVTRLLVTGATGMVGAGALVECLADDRVRSVVALTRSPVGRAHPKLIAPFYPIVRRLLPNAY